MEHRCAQRQVLELHVLLSGPRLVPQPAKTRNISVGGLFVETAQGALPTGTVVTVAVPLGNAGARRHLGLEALVVHSSTAGAGLMFCAPARADLLAAILTELREPPRLAGAYRCRH